MTLTQRILTSAMVVLGTVLTRFLPFLLFPAGKPTPKVVTYLDGPFYPDSSLPLPERKQRLRDQCHAAMVKRAEENSTYAYYEYREEA